MPADRGLGGPNWHPKPDFQLSRDIARDMQYTGWIPKDKTEYILFLCKVEVLPEMEPYEHDVTGRRSIAEWIADIAYQPLCSADELTDDYITLVSTPDDLSSLSSDTTLTTTV